MARAKKHKHNNRRRQGFYEALPMSITPPAVIPAESERIITEGLSSLKRAWQSFSLAISAFKWDKLWHFDTSRLRKYAKAASDDLGTAGHWISAQTIIIAGQTSKLSVLYWRRALAGAGTATDAIVGYAPPIAADFAASLDRLRRRLTGRIARRVYISLAVIALIGATTFGVITAIHTVNAFASSISSPAALLANKKTGTTILDRNGQVLYEAYGAQHTTVDPLNQLPSNLINATLSAEDPGFYSEPAISIKGTLRAALVDITHHGAAVEGGSTLTQQLVKNALLNPNKSYWRKYQEILLAFDLEQRYSKNQILDMYLNETYYGQGASGVEAASQTYFHKPASQLTLSESALIAGLPLGPSIYDPNASVDDATGRRNYVLSRMVALGKITGQEAQAAEAEPIVLAGESQATPPDNAMMVYSQQANVKAPWFDYYVLAQLRQQYGDQEVEQGDLTVKTTLDLGKENDAEQDIQTQISKLGSHNVTNGALVSLDPKTGDILAMVGSVDYNAPGFGQVNATIAQLQPGSSFKPIVYATAFEKGWTGATTVLDAPITFPGGYTPQNYDLKYHGVVTLRHALDNSLNIPAVKVMQFAGIPASLNTAHDMGITTLNDPSQYGLSLVLGAGDVTPLDMATVYATFDNLGTKVEPRAILSVTNRDGKDITKPDPNQPKQVLDPRIAFMITNILSDVNARLPEFPANSPLTLDRVAAAKTGTTTDFADNWTIGYTPQIVTAVWVGNNNHTPMQNVDGITGAAPIWHDYMEQALAGTPVEAFTQPSGLVFADVCSNGALAQGFSTNQAEVFMAGHLPTQTCSNDNSDVAASQPAQNNPSNNDNSNQQADNPPPAPPSPSPVETPPATPAPPVGFFPPGGP
jgi:1A family penicillin-binding protein